MRARSAAVLTTLAMVSAAACTSGSESDATLPEITLITTTSEVVFEIVDSLPAEAVPADPTTPDETDVTDPTESAPTTVAPDPTTTVETTTTTTIPVTTTTEPAASRFSLQTDGLGSTSFGADPDGTIAFISSFLGEPTGDTGWQDAFNFGACGGAELRQVNWGNLQLEFGDSSSVTQGRRHFYAFSYGLVGSSEATPAGLETLEGITVGSSVGSLLASYPNILLLRGDEFIPDNFVINDNLRGRLSGLTDNDVVQMIIGGLPCEG